MSRIIGFLKMTLTSLSPVRYTPDTKLITRFEFKWSLFPWGCRNTLKVRAKTKPGPSKFDSHCGLGIGQMWLISCPIIFQ